MSVVDSLLVAGGFVLFVVSLLVSFFVPFFAVGLVVGALFGIPGPNTAAGTGFTLLIGLSGMFGVVFTLNYVWSMP